MTHERLERDSTIGTALRSVAADPGRVPVDWVGLRGTIARQAATELARRRGRHRWIRVAIPAALAASIALLLLVSRGPEEQVVADTGVERLATAAAGPATVDKVLDADVSDRQFRALLFGADEVEDLLMIAAEEEALSFP
jgi:hypothetical protein